MRLVLALSTLLALGTVLWPNGTDIRRLQIETWVWVWSHTGKPDWFTPDVWSAVANMTLFAVPAAVLVAITRARWWAVAVCLVLVSAGVELYQELALTGIRQGSVSDVLTNGAGAVAGALVGSQLRRDPQSAPE